MRPFSPLLVLLPTALFACGRPASLDLADSGQLDTGAPADTGTCPALAFEPAELTLGPASSAEVDVVGCAEGLDVACPSWATLTLADPAVAGDVALVETVPGASGPLEGSCVVSWSTGSAALDLVLEAS